MNATPKTATSKVDWTKPPAKKKKRGYGWVWIVIGAMVGGGVVAYLQQHFNW